MITAAVVLLVLAFFALFLAARVANEVLERWANVSGILSLLLSLLAFVWNIEGFSLPLSAGGEKFVATHSPIATFTDVVPFSNAVDSDFPVMVSRPTIQEYVQLPNLWWLAEGGNSAPRYPGEYIFKVDTIDTHRAYGWGAIWCGKNDAILEQILRPLSMKLIVNNRMLTNEEIVGFYATQNGWRCYRWGTKLSNWKSGATVTLELKYSLSHDIFDGESVTHEGNYRLLMKVAVP